MTGRHCRACHERIEQPTMGGNVPAHYDGAGRNPCPASGKPFAALTAEDTIRPAATTAADYRAGALLTNLERLLAS